MNLFEKQIETGKGEHQINIWSGESRFGWLREKRTGIGDYCEKKYLECEQILGKNVHSYGKTDPYDADIDGSSTEVKTASQKKSGSDIFLFNQISHTPNESVSNVVQFVFIFVMPNRIEVYEMSREDLLLNIDTKPKIFKLIPKSEGGFNLNIKYISHYLQNWKREYADDFCDPFSYFEVGG